MSLEKGKSVIWDSGFGYEFATLLGEGNSYDTYQVRVLTGENRGVNTFPKSEIKAATKDNLEEVIMKYGPATGTIINKPSANGPSERTGFLLDSLGEVRSTYDDYVKELLHYGPRASQYEEPKVIKGFRSKPAGFSSHLIPKKKKRK